jgi:hypothetical protein
MEKHEMKLRLFLKKKKLASYPTLCRELHLKKEPLIELLQDLEKDKVIVTLEHCGRNFVMLYDEPAPQELMADEAQVA